MRSVFITSAEACCALGATLTECEASFAAGKVGLRPLGELLGNSCAQAGLLGGWIADRGVLRGRRYGAATNAALHAARLVVEKAGWSAADRREAWIFAGSSRGNALELVGNGVGRRRVRAFAASNTMHSEIAAAASIELQIRGPWHVLASGCCAGLDALGMACQAVAGGAAPRALVIAADLPLAPEILQQFADSRLLSRNNVSDPYSPQTSGFLPGEGAAAVTLEAAPSVGGCQATGYHVESDGYDALALPADGGGFARCLVRADAPGQPPLAALCPHATGTREHGRVESAALGAFFSSRKADLPLALLKPWTGHTLGASGLLDVALLLPWIVRGQLPPHPTQWPAAPGPGREIPRGAAVLKLAASMGGHHAGIALVR
jgi:3-oxoacyl-[acyl-carrier-protein] synthase II